ncbi:MAG TPA: AAA domain-containing protein, partial [Chitinophagales bacterium]|nr:AAA domain-containing protein [Chitinophagales bacterium]
WYLKIERDTRKSNTWIISRNEDLPVVVNPVLLSYLQGIERISLSELNEFVDDDLVTEQELLNTVELISERLGNKQVIEPKIATVLPCTNKEAIENLTKEQAWIRFSGVFGLYKTIKQSIINDVETIIQNDNIASLANAEHKVHYNEILTPVRLDATQEQILYALQEHQKIIIQGPPGTGKSQTLTAIITNALLNNKKILVVCEKKTALEVLQQNLLHLGLEHLSVLIEDVYKDRKVVVEKIRSFIDNNNKTVERFRSNEFEQAKQEFIYLRDKINHQIHQSQISFFGDDNLIELVIKTEQLKEKLEDKNEVIRLGNHIQNSLFEFNIEEFKALFLALKSAKVYLDKLPENLSIFEKINRLRFNDKLENLQDLVQKYTVEVETLWQSISTYKNQSSYNLIKGFKAIWNKILAVFSSSKQQLIKKQNSDLNAFQTLVNSWNIKPLLDITLNPQIPIERMEECLIELNKINAELSILQDNKAQLQDFYKWKNYCFAQDEKTKYLLNVIAQSKINSPLEVFEVWYYEQVKLNFIVEHKLTDKDIVAMEALEESDEALKILLSSKIKNIWETKKQESISKRDEATLKYLYNLRKNKQYESKNTLRKIVQEDLDFFTDCFPVVFTNPEVCASIFPAQPYFDLIILDEASQLKIEETYTSLLRGKQHIISGDKHQMPPSNFFGNTVLFFNETENEEDETSDFLAEAQSLLEFADDAGYKNHYIDFHYRSKHPDLIQFSNHAFYQSRLIPMPAKEDYCAIEYYDINGLYEKGVNQSEAQAVVDYLFSIDISKEIPSVGIGTFNLYQRNYISDLIFNRAMEDDVVNKHLESLLSKGLFIKNLENIQGDERDIILLSTTFGNDKEGKFRQLFGPLSQEKGYKLLNVIITRSKSKSVIFTSIPNTFIQQYATEIPTKGNVGKGILYAYLAYAKSISEQNAQQQQFILTQLGENKQSQLRENNLFVDFVFNELKPKLGDGLEKYKTLG